MAGRRKARGLRGLLDAYAAHRTICTLFSRGTETGSTPERSAEGRTFVSTHLVSLRLGQCPGCARVLWERGRALAAGAVGDRGALPGGERAGDGRHRQVGPGGHAHAPAGLLVPGRGLSFRARCTPMPGPARRLLASALARGAADRTTRRRSRPRPAARVLPDAALPARAGQPGIAAASARSRGPLSSGLRRLR